MRIITGVVKKQNKKTKNSTENRKKLLLAFFRFRPFLLLACLGVGCWVLGVGCWVMKNTKWSTFGGTAGDTKTRKIGRQHFVSLNTTKQWNNSAKNDRKSKFKLQK